MSSVKPTQHACPTVTGWPRLARTAISTAPATPPPTITTSRDCSILPPSSLHGQPVAAMSRGRAGSVAVAQTLPERVQGGGAVGHRHGHRENGLLGTFGALRVKVPRARLSEPDGGTKEWRMRRSRRPPRRTSVCTSQRLRRSGSPLPYHCSRRCARGGLQPCTHARNQRCQMDAQPQTPVGGCPRSPPR